MEKSPNTEIEHDSTEPTGKKDSRPCSMEIKSTAVVKYQIAETPSRFLKLTTKTDLNQAPANWLRSSAKLPFQYLPCSSRKAFSSFGMANSFPDCVGEVDVVSDAENIKKLLKIPFSKTHVSMMVHRIGKTLLLDEFDVHDHLLRASQKQWEWLKKFYYEHVLESLHVNDKCLRKNKSRDHLQNKYMLSKFLHYSTMEDTSIAGDDDDEDDIFRNETEINVETLERPKMSSPVRSYISKDLQESHSPPLEKPGQDFLRNVLWTFEDIRMLIGSDLPIFGGGTHPVVTLRLRDVQKPINVLTGLDYWLDNLMCNVPDVFMCYHLNGIVQQYELIKTEDIPQLKGSHFSPKVVKDVAQNILSFLKAKATKSGHTYWLFRGKNDDVVKLYDLTTLCEDTDSERNPFTLPVAMLLFKVAKNMKGGVQTCNSGKEEDRKGKTDSKTLDTIHKLLLNCLTLLNPKEQPQVVLSVHNLLTDLYLPENLDPSNISAQTSLSSDSSGNVKEDSESESSSPTSETEDELEEEEDISSVEVRALCVPCKYVVPKNEGQRAPLSKDWKDRCLAALKHVLQGLDCLTYMSVTKSASEKEREMEQEVTYFGSRAESIPLPFTPLDKGKQTKERSEVSQAVQQSNNQKLGPYKARLLYKGTKAYAGLAELSLSNMHLGSALRKVKLGFMLYESAKQVDTKANEGLVSVLPCLLSLAGDCYALLCKGSPQDYSTQESYFQHTSEMDTQIIEHCSNDGTNSDFNWCWHWPADSAENQLLLSYRCYSCAMKFVLPSSRDVTQDKNSTAGKQCWERLAIRSANICNELGVHYMNSAMKAWAQNGGIGSAEANNISELPGLLKKSREYLLKGLTGFCDVHDKLNQALLHSNLARLARLEASLAVPFDPGTGQRKEFSTTERKKHREAVNQYRQALNLLNGLSQPHLQDNIRWDLCTSLFTAACLLQDYAPLSRNAQEKVEEEVCEWLKGALQLCKESDSNSSRHPLYQYRMAGVLHRMASLHHHAYRNQALDERRQKQHRESADSCYDQSASLFLELGNSQEFLRVLLERIALWEHLIARQTGFSSRVKSLLTVLRHVISSLPLFKQLNSTERLLQNEVEDSREISSDDTNQKMENSDQVLGLLMLLQERLVYILTALTKAYSSKANTHGHALETWNQVLNIFNTSSHLKESFNTQNLLKGLELVEENLKASL